MSDGISEHIEVERPSAPEIRAGLVDISQLTTPEERITARSYHEFGLDRRAVELHAKLREQIAASAEPIDFGTTALDVGSRDGRYTQVIRELGIENIVAIDPSAEELQKGVDHGLLAPSEVFPGTLEAYVAQGHPQVDSVFVFNVAPPLSRSRQFTDALMSIVKPGGIVVTSCIERETNVRLATSTYLVGKVEAIRMKPVPDDLEFEEEIDQGGNLNHFLNIGRRTVIQ